MVSHRFEVSHGDSIWYDVFKLHFAHCFRFGIVTTRVQSEPRAYTHAIVQRAYHPPRPIRFTYLAEVRHKDPYSRSHTLRRCCIGSRVLSLPFHLKLSSLTLLDCCILRHKEIYIAARGTTRPAPLYRHHITAPAVHPTAIFSSTRTDICTI